MTPAIGLVVVDGGVAYVAEPAHVRIEIVDLDNIRAGDKPPVLPAGVGFEELADRSGLIRGKEIRFSRRKKI